MGYIPISGPGMMAYPVAQSALCADCLKSIQTGERSGSRPKPPEAVARSASIEPGRSPGYAFNFTVALPHRGRGNRQLAVTPLPHCGRDPQPAMARTTLRENVARLGDTRTSLCDKRVIVRGRLPSGGLATPWERLVRAAFRYHHLLPLGTESALGSVITV